MQRSDDNDHDLTEADRDSETRFGPRKVPEGHRTASPYPHRPMRSSRVIPSGRVSPDGREPWPMPSTTAKVVVWGGIALGVAGLTAGAIMATRKIAGMIADEGGRRPYHVGVGAGIPERDRRAPDTLAPRFAELDEEEREEIRRRARAQAREDSRAAAQRRAEAARRRNPPRRNIAAEMTDTATSLSAGLNGLADSLASAFTGFRSVAAQASAIIGEFAATAQQVRDLMGRGDAAADRPAGGAGAADDRDHGPKRDDDRRTHRL